VRCWLASEDLKIGEKIRVGIDESIRFHDKLLLVLSKHSVASGWVEQEVETALARERKEKRAVLFPIRLDDTIMKIETGWPAHIKNSRNIGDFRKWRNPEAYQKAFDRLLCDLKADE
jgi:TIR domain